MEVKGMSERLEEIKERYSNAVDIALSAGETLPEYEIEVADLNYLIQQAEQKEEWESVAIDRYRDWEKAHLVNQRYKQALEFYANENNYIHDEWKPLNPNAISITMSQVEFDDGEKARQALKGEYQ